MLFFLCFTQQYTVSQLLLHSRSSCGRKTPGDGGDCGSRKAVVVYNSPRKISLLKREELSSNQKPPPLKAISCFSQLGKVWKQRQKSLCVFGETNLVAWVNLIGKRCCLWQIHTKLRFELGEMIAKSNRFQTCQIEFHNTISQS